MKGSMSYNKGFNKKIKRKLKKNVAHRDIKILEKFAEEGVIALSNATPSKTGLTASSWYYEIVEEENRISIIWCNKHVENGVNIAVILDSGHVTKNGSWVAGYNYIDSAIDPIKDKIKRYINE